MSEPTISFTTSQSNINKQMQIQEEEEQIQYARIIKYLTLGQILVIDYYKDDELVRIRTFEEEAPNRQLFRSRKSQFYLMKKESINCFAGKRPDYQLLISDSSMTDAMSYYFRDLHQFFGFCFQNIDKFMIFSVSLPTITISPIQHPVTKKLIPFKSLKIVKIHLKETDFRKLKTLKKSVEQLKDWEYDYLLNHSSALLGKSEENVVMKNHPVKEGSNRNAVIAQYQAQKLQNVSYNELKYLLDSQVTLAQHQLQQKHFCVVSTQLSKCEFTYEQLVNKKTPPQRLQFLLQLQLSKQLLGKGFKNSDIFKILQQPSWTNLMTRNLELPNWKFNLVEELQKIQKNGKLKRTQQIYNQLLKDGWIVKYSELKTIFHSKFYGRRRKA